MNSNVLVTLIQTIGEIVISLLGKSGGKEKNLFIEAIESMHEVYSCLNDVVSHNGCSRAMLLYSENGGGIPQGRSDLFVTISHEIHTEAESIRHEVQRLPVDFDYIQLLQALLNSKEGILFIETEKMNQGLLKDIYIKAGTAQSLIFRLTETKNKLYYCSFNFKKDHPVTDECFRNCTLQASKIKKIIKHDQKRIRNLFSKK